MKASTGIFFALAWAGAAGASLLENPSFETPDGLGDWQVVQAEGWVTWGDWVQRRADSPAALDGTCVMAYEAWKTEVGNMSGFYQDVKGTLPGSKYTFTIFALKDKAAEIEAVEVRLEPIKGGKPIASETYRARSFGENVWKPLTVSGHSTTDGLRIRVLIKPTYGESREGLIRFDDASLEVIE